MWNVAWFTTRLCAALGVAIMVTDRETGGQSFWERRYPGPIRHNDHPLVFDVPSRINDVSQETVERYTRWRVNYALKALGGR